MGPITATEAIDQVSSGKLGSRPKLLKTSIWDLKKPSILIP